LRRRAPADESFWVTSTRGSGNVALARHPRAGNWRAVVVNADGSRGITAQLQLGACTSLLWWLGGGLVAAVATLAASLYRKSRA
jgi:hypothetical protein